jgi:hypothetical protein
MTGTAQEPSKTANECGVKRAIVHRRAGQGDDEVPEVGEQHFVNSPELGKKLVGKCALSVKGGGNPVGSRLRMAVARRTRRNRQCLGALRRRRPLLDTEDGFEASTLRRVRIAGCRDLAPRIRQLERMLEKLLVSGSSADGAEELEKHGYDGGNLIDIDDGIQADRSGKGRVLNVTSQCSHRKLKRVLVTNGDDVQSLWLRHESRSRK